jgi:hypothetical protein
MAPRDRSPFGLVPLDSEGEWNRPLLENAAAISGADCIFASSNTEGREPSVRAEQLEEVLSRFRHTIACEVARDSVGIYDFPAPRERTAVLVGNELTGIPRSVLKKVDRVVSIPMAGTGISSVNVAVSAAIVLYVLSRDIGRIRRIRNELPRRAVDILIDSPSDAHELGSLLRSAWCFGWRRVFLRDPDGVWFTKDKATIMDSRAAARRHKNPMAVLPSEQLDWALYDHVVACEGKREGRRLSRFQLPDIGNLLVVYGPNCDELAISAPVERVFVDLVNPQIGACYRHQGSILLSYVSELLKA